MYEYFHISKGGLLITISISFRRSRSFDLAVSVSILGKKVELLYDVPVLHTVGILKLGVAVP